ncbi:MAG: AbrB/MazE/SpoVT family DNA-binding domain-containing protein [Firmicutes bacterium]|nr:AbrB/MazE/SpoVT family DNA-binding domain-containing protein [Bacillota bacterium]
MEGTYVSSKGQVVIPKAIRDAAGLRVRTRLKVTLKEDGILLTPVRAAAVDALYGRFGGQDLIADLEAEHWTEVQRDSEIGARRRESGLRGSPRRQVQRGLFHIVIRRFSLAETIHRLVSL